MVDVLRQLGGSGRCLGFLDFLEALVRLAGAKLLPDPATTTTEEKEEEEEEGTGTNVGGGADVVEGRGDGAAEAVDAAAGAAEQREWWPKGVASWKGDPDGSAKLAHFLELLFRKGFE